MPDVIQSREGYATVQYQFIVDKTKIIAFNTQDITFVDAEIKDDVYGNGTGMHTFRTLDPSFLDTLKLVMSDANPVLEFRLGLGSPTDMIWLPWQRHIVVNYYAKYEGIAAAAGHLLVIVTANSLIRFERSNKVEARTGSISEIVKTIADENETASVIEPTSGKFLLYQCFIDDTRFIRERLLQRAITVKGQGGFYFYVRDNVIHFHTPDYQGDVRQMNYYDVFGTELSVHDNSQNPLLWDEGLSGVRVVGYDPYTGQNKEVNSDPQNALRLANSIYQFGNVPDGQWNFPYHLSSNPTVEVSALAQFHYQTARMRTFKCHVALDKTITIRHGDLLNLSVTQENSKASSYSGYYYVTAAAHAVRKQAVTSFYTLERGEIQGQSQSLTAQNTQSQLIPTTEAPGNTPNILEVQSSEITKGAGKQSSTRTYTVVVDAKTGKPRT